MSTTQILVLGAVAGLTIFLGLPAARLRDLDVRVRASLSAVATGILLFLFWDVLSNGVQPVEQALNHAVKGGGDWGRFFGLGALLAAGFVAGLTSLVYYERWMRTRRASPLVGPGAAAVDEFAARTALERLTAGRQLALLIATGIGLHNFGEGLAIGQAGAAGAISLALLLIVGFGLHNATEGFGIIGPLAADGDRPSWRFLALLGLIAGGPTFVGTVVGQAVVSDALSVVFFAVAAGSILYVVQQLFQVNGRFNMPILVTWMLLLGLFLGFATDWVLEAAQLAT